MSGLIPSAPPSQQDGYDYVASISKSAGVGGGARKMQKAEEHKYHYYTEDEDDGGGRGKCALYDNLEKGGGGGGGDKHQPISQDDARLLRLEHMAEVNHHRLDALEQQGQGRSTRGRKRAGTMMLWVLVTALFACYLLLMAGLIAIFFFSTHDDRNVTASNSSRFFQSCLQAAEESDRSGVYLLTLDPTGAPFSVSAAPCLMGGGDDLGLGGGWTVIQRRGQFGNPEDYFHRNFDEYLRGFGELEKEFWLGLEAIQRLTTSAPHELAVVLTEVGDEGRKVVARYSSFKLEGPDFRLSVGGHGAGAADLAAGVAVAGDPLTAFADTAFSAPDRDRDASERGHCAQKYRSGWWFASCGASNLNGINHNSAEAPRARGIVFTDEDHPFTYSYAGATMLIRSTSAK